MVGDRFRQHRLAGARLPFDQQRFFEGDGGIDRHLQCIGGEILAAS